MVGFLLLLSTTNFRIFNRGIEEISETTKEELLAPLSDMKINKSSCNAKIVMEAIKNNDESNHQYSLNTI